MKAPRPVRLGVLGSGKGSNFGVIQESFLSGSLGCQPVIVISDVENSGILVLAKSFGVPCHYVEPGPFRTRLSADAEAEVVRLLREAGVDFIVLAGFMRIIKESLLSAFPGRILNIHPSLLPSFRGLEAWQQALNAGVAETGCTVHMVDADIDTGRILGQSIVPVLPGDSAETLHARIQAAEHELYPNIIRDFAEQLTSEEKGAV